jgi:hypothetical protein
VYQISTGKKLVKKIAQKIVPSFLKGEGAWKTKGKLEVAAKRRIVD